ncbi:SDR family oxidoreductase [Erythrobacter insulae]|uniref:SDR family oxidoreductase n=1 Tax=Erythrobacter insulae TaxID=2584124 RepID=A0A547P7B3_9SPHN|nr:SDR family NAD(P)-dependent oxidoreductase [Erythrobacter insulae]TRD10019.1 SDR family oxidoreductase [Erythrobacter insulae]
MGDRLKGKIAIITGATGGIGEASVRRFLDEGASVMMTGRNSDKLAKSAKRLGSGDRLSYFTADVVDEEQTKASIEATAERFGGLDVVFANAGIEGVIQPIEEQTQKDVLDVLQPNVIGVWNLLHHAIPHLKKRGGGSIMITSSTAGLTGFPGLSAYCASKHAVIGMMRTAAAELAPDRIRVNTINPGPIDNRMIASVENQLSTNGPESARARIEAMVPMARYGTNEEVANLAVFLASDESTYTTGSVNVIDGGLTAL